jgi:hypothetical protein
MEEFGFAERWFFVRQKIWSKKVWEMSLKFSMHKVLLGRNSKQAVGGGVVEVTEMAKGMVKEMVREMVRVLVTLSVVRPKAKEREMQKVKRKVKLKVERFVRSLQVSTAAFAAGVLLRTAVQWT